jgi:hypothetical protein
MPTSLSSLPFVYPYIAIDNFINGAIYICRYLMVYITPIISNLESVGDKLLELKDTNRYNKLNSQSRQREWNLSPNEKGAQRSNTVALLYFGFQL